LSYATYRERKEEGLPQINQVFSDRKFQGEIDTASMSSLYYIIKYIETRTSLKVQKGTRYKTEEEIKSK